jgi:hypothetical protein
MSTVPEPNPPMTAELWWPGVFRPLLHDVSRQGKPIIVRAVRIYFAECGSACRAPGGRPPDGYRHCPECLARRELLTRLDVVTPTRHRTVRPAGALPETAPAGPPPATP